MASGCSGGRQARPLDRGVSGGGASRGGSAAASGAASAARDAYQEAERQNFRPAAALPSSGLAMGHESQSRPAPTCSRQTTGFTRHSSPKKVPKQIRKNPYLIQGDGAPGRNPQTARRSSARRSARGRADREIEQGTAGLGEEEGKGKERRAGS